MHILITHILKHVSMPDGLTLCHPCCNSSRNVAFVVRPIPQCHQQSRKGSQKQHRRTILLLLEIDVFPPHCQYCVMPTVAASSSIRAHFTLDAVALLDILSRGLLFMMLMYIVTYKIFNTQIWITKNQRDCNVGSMNNAARSITFVWPCFPSKICFMWSDTWDESHIVPKSPRNNISHASNK